MPRLFLFQMWQREFAHDGWSTFRQDLLVGLTVAAAALFLTGCAGSAPAGELSRPTPIPTLAPLASRAAPQAALGANLLTAADLSIACDQTEGAALICATQGAQQWISVTVGASQFARWTLHLPEIGLELTGREVLAMDLYAEGDVSVNLYVVDGEGRRISRPLPRSALEQGGAPVYFPLREIQGKPDVQLDVTALREVQLVFEWADMVGSLVVDAVRLLPTWEETSQIPSRAVGIEVPDGFVVEPVAAGTLAPTQIQVVSTDTLLISSQNGRIWRYQDTDGDGRYETRLLYASGFWEVVGLLYDPTDGAVWVGGRGQLWYTADTTGDGIADLQELRVDGLPWGRHQNNGLTWNPVADPFSGEPAHTWIYFGLGSTGDLEVGEDLSATVLRFPRQGRGQKDLQVVARGVRNAYGLLWAPVDLGGQVEWALFAGENGPDYQDFPDEVNHIRWSHHYGFPTQFGMVEPPESEGAPYSSPVYEVAAHASANSLVYVTNPDWPQEYRTLYVSLFGSIFSPQPSGQTVDRIDLVVVEGAAGPTYRGAASIFAAGLERPLPMAVDTFGDLLVGDYATGIIYRVRYDARG